MGWGRQRRPGRWKGALEGKVCVARRWGDRWGSVGHGLESWESIHIAETARNPQAHPVIQLLCKAMGLMRVGHPGELFSTVGPSYGGLWTRVKALEQMSLKWIC